MREGSRQVRGSDIANKSTLPHVAQNSKQASYSNVWRKINSEISAKSFAPHNYATKCFQVSKLQATNQKHRKSSDTAA